MIWNSSLRAQMRRATPEALRRVVRRFRSAWARRTNAGLSLREVFERVYARNQWRGAKGQFCSGDGSSEGFARPYAESIQSLIGTHGVKTILDLGCGDFAVGRLLASPGVKYTGVDVVEPLIQRNRVLFENDHTRFLCLDMTSDALPMADLCLVRQVLQHLSNAEIRAVLE